MDLAFNNLQRLICHKTNNQTNKPYYWERQLESELLFLAVMSLYHTFGIKF